VDRMLRQVTVFGRGSNVLDYWLAHAEGFEVLSGIGRRQRVERVLVDHVQHRATGLVVRSSRLPPPRRRRVIPAEAVSAVDPFARLFQLERKHGKTRLTRGQAVSMLVAGAARVGRALVTLAHAIACWSLAAVAWLRPRLRQGRILAGRCGRSFAIGIGSAVSWLRPRLRASAASAGVATLALGIATVESSHRRCRRLLQRRGARQIDDTGGRNRQA
jgi:hypothetical protein